MEQIKRYENELISIITNDKKSWARFYLLMKEVEEKELYKQANKNSFTAWVKDFCINNKIHESIIWNRKKAGRVYEEYARIQAQRGIEVLPIEETNVSMDSLVLLDKISKKAPDLGEELIHKAINKEITREDLRTAYKTIRGDFNKHKEKNNSKHEKSDNIKQVKDNITASKIVQVIINNTEWLGVKELKRKAFRPANEQDKYKALTDFVVYTGTSKHSRRIDVVVAENLTVEHYELNLHGIEIKVSENDLLNDKKYIEYSEFVNYLWIAVPEHLLFIAKETVPQEIGILLIHEEHIDIIKSAQKLNPLYIDKTLTTIALKLI